jgi:hypothetical protein
MNNNVGASIITATGIVASLLHLISYCVRSGMGHFALDIYSVRSGMGHFALDFLLCTFILHWICYCVSVGHLAMD